MGFLPRQAELAEECGKHRYVRSGGRSPRSYMRILGIVALSAALGGCAIQRAQIAQGARAQMVGMSREQVLVCMGPQANKAAGQTEVWSYNSGDGTTVTTDQSHTETSLGLHRSGSARSMW